VRFDSAGLSAKVLGVRDLPEAARVVRPGVDTGAAVVNGPKQEAKLELTVAQDIEPGVHAFASRRRSERRTSPPSTLVSCRRFRRSNRTTPKASQSNCPPQSSQGRLAGRRGHLSVQRPGRRGSRLRARRFGIGSPLQSVLVLRDSTGKELARAGDVSRRPDAVLTAKLPADGKYTISLSDFERRGGEGFFYRLNAGALPYVTEVFPLGLRAGQSARSK